MELSLLRCDCVLLPRVLVFISCGTMFVYFHFFQRAREEKKGKHKKDERVEPKQLFNACNLPYNLRLHVEASGVLSSGMKERIHPLVESSTNNLTDDCTPLTVERLPFSQNSLGGHNCCVGICVSVCNQA